jgi:hypothetical protein
MPRTAQAWSVIGPERRIKGLGRVAFDASGRQRVTTSVERSRPANILMAIS